MYTNFNMKNLYNYLTEKLKLSEINKDNLDGRWVDAKDINFKELKEGYIIELKCGQLYVVIPLNLFIKLRSFKTITAYDYILVNIGHFGNPYLEYMILDSYQDTYPENKCKNNNFIIKRVYIRSKQYTNADEAYKDVYDVCKHNKIK